MDLFGVDNGDSFPQLGLLHITAALWLSEVICDDVSMPKLNKVIVVEGTSEIRLSERLAKLEYEKAQCVNRDAFENVYPLEVFAEEHLLNLVMMKCMPVGITMNQKMFGVGLAILGIILSRLAIFLALIWAPWTACGIKPKCWSNVGLVWLTGHIASFSLDLLSFACG